MLQGAREGRQAVDVPALAASDQWRILPSELFKQSAGIEMVHVPYPKGSAQVVTDVIGGHVDLIVAGPPLAIPLIEGKKLKAICCRQYMPTPQKRLPLNVR